jgi:hypothetical protein
MISLNILPTNILKRLGLVKMQPRKKGKYTKVKPAFKVLKKPSGKAASIYVNSL